MKTFALALLMVAATSSIAQAPMKAMAPDADPSFEVATIKPSDHAAQQSVYSGGFSASGRSIASHNVSLLDMLVYAYGLQVKQLVGLPAWADKDRFDISGVPDIEGKPSYPQIKRMWQKLLADRFQLKSHSESRELPAYVLEVAKDGPKLPKNDSGQPAPGAVQMMMSVPGMMTFRARNATMTEFAWTLQQNVLDRPVVNRTELKDRYDFQLSFAPTGSEFGGRVRLAPGDDTEAPSLFTAVQAFGLKLEAMKTAVEVLVVDGVEKPTGN